MELVHYETFDQFSPSSFEIHGFSPFNQILLSLLTFQARFIIVFDLTLKQKCVKQYKQFKYKPEMRTKYQINLTKSD